MTPTDAEILAAIDKGRKEVIYDDNVGHLERSINEKNRARNAHADDLAALMALAARIEDTENDWSYTDATDLRQIVVDRCREWGTYE